jgi:hypothetical protein
MAINTNKIVETKRILLQLQKNSAVSRRNAPFIQLIRSLKTACLSVSLSVSYTFCIPNAEIPCALSYWRIIIIVECLKLDYNDYKSNIISGWQKTKVFIVHPFFKVLLEP